MCTSKRESFLTINEQLAVAPGPGYYSPPSTSMDAPKGGASLQNRVREQLESLHSMGWFYKANLKQAKS